MFAIEDFWTGDMASFMLQQPSTYFIKALEDSEFLMITKENYERLFQEIPNFERFYRNLYQRSLVSYIHRIKLVIDPSNSHISLIGLAYESGFNSKTVFNTAFKKTVGMTPLEFQKSQS